MVDINSPLIELVGVTKNYHTKAGAFPALKGIDLDIYPGEFLGVVGKSGAGKSTLLNMITGVDQTSSGEVRMRTNGETINYHRTHRKRAHSLAREDHGGYLPKLPTFTNAQPSPKRNDAYGYERSVPTPKKQGTGTGTP